nr:immunoglobulin light chain junction region [Macaca mulatta]
DYYCAAWDGYLSGPVF